GSQREARPFARCRPARPIPRWELRNGSSDAGDNSRCSPRGRRRRQHPPHTLLPVAWSGTAGGGPLDGRSAALEVATKRRPPSRMPAPESRREVRFAAFAMSRTGTRFRSPAPPGCPDEMRSPPDLDQFYELLAILCPIITVRDFAVHLRHPRPCGCTTWLANTRRSLAIYRS